MNYSAALIFIWIFLRVSGDRFDRYSGEKVERLVKDPKHKNATKVCSIEVKACAPHEGSRVDGTCNNYKHPSKGSARGPYLRILSPDYGNKQEIRRSTKGTPLPSARLVRTSIQSSGRVEDKSIFNVAAAHFLEFVHRDISFMGPLDKQKQIQQCCQPEGEKDRHCIPIKVPDNDPYLKVTDIRCLNVSRAETFQDDGCAPEIPPQQINFQTPLLDLSTIYGVDDESLSTVREYKNGLLKLEKRGDRYVPFNISTSKDTDKQHINKNICVQNDGNDTICYKFGFPEVGNLDLRTTTIAIFFMREHNRLARALRHMNPCWRDDRLFKVARQINIATAANIYMYELLPALLGFENMVRYALIFERVQHLTAYDGESVPLVYAEFDIGSRYFHTMIDGRVKRYDESYHYVGDFPLSETLFRQGLIERNKNFEEMNRGMFFQNAAKIDDVQDPEISENFYGGLQRAHDLAAIDIQRGRDLGLRGYNEYRHLCGLKTAKKFEDFLDVMDFETVLALKNMYDDINDVDLLAGIMSENHVKGTLVGPTLFCIIVKQWQLFRFSDRFWFERGDQLHSLSLRQLHEIRRTNMARLACDNVEAIKHIQPQAFINVGHRNMHVPCTHIIGPDLSKWRDSTCVQKQDINSQKKNYSQSNDVPLKNGTSMDYTTFFNSMLNTSKRV